jgi:hypothetical protein
MLKTKLTQGGPSGSSPLRSDGSRDGQVRSWTKLTMAKDSEMESWKTTFGATGPNEKQA